MTNIGTLERIFRVVLGGALAVWAVSQLLSSGDLIWLFLNFALVVLGADFVYTGIRGYCPLYNVLGLSTAKSATRI